VRVVVLRGEGKSFSAGLDRQAFTPEGFDGEPSFLDMARGPEADLDATIAADVVLSGLAKRYLKEVPRRRIRLLRQAGELAASRCVAIEAAARFPTDASFAAITAGTD
jgi:hypothetical protein